MKNSYRDQIEKEQVQEDLDKAAKQMGEKPAKPVVKPVVLAVGDTLRANGCLYRVRKRTAKDFVIRLIGVENRPGVEIPRGQG